jgi:hypothetical protein
MSSKTEIMKNMKQTVGVGTDKVADIAPEGWEEHFDDIGSFKASDTPHFRVKISHMIEANKLHMQFGTNEVGDLHQKMMEDLRTPYVLLSGKILRNYGLAFDLIVKGNSIDGHQLRELGHKVRDANVSVISLAQADDYCMMEFVGVEDGEDNTGQPCKMLVFELAPECRVYIRFSDIEPVVIESTKSLPELRAEWLLAWLCANFLEEEE